MCKDIFIGGASHKSGIYLISHSISRAVYVGQSLHIRARLGEHYEMLTTGAHRNVGLQALWNSHPPDTFSTSIYLACPKGLSPLERQRWLVKAERQAIQELKKSWNVVNMAEPEIVETPDALSEFKRMKAAKDKLKTTSVSCQRRAIKIRIDTLNQRLAPLRVAHGSCFAEIAQREEVMRKSKSIFAFFIGRPSSESIPIQEARLVALKKKLDEIERTIAPDQQECDMLSDEYRKLYFGFPKVQEQRVKRVSLRWFPLTSGRKMPTITEEDKDA